ncbi:hypothetical protein ACP4OV_005281 [Aristida adscensionis]
MERGAPPSSTAEAGNEAAAGSSIEAATAQEKCKAKPAGTRRTKLVKVTQEYIDCILKDREERPPGPFPKRSLESIDKLHADATELREEVCSAWAQAAALMNSLREEEGEILRQWQDTGSAMREIEIGDSDEDVEVPDENGD